MYMYSSCTWHSIIYYTSLLCNAHMCAYKYMCMCTYCTMYITLAEPLYRSIVSYMYSESIGVSVYDMCRVINPRRACAARVTVVGRCVCLSVRHSVC